MSVMHVICNFYLNVKINVFVLHNVRLTLLYSGFFLNMSTNLAFEKTSKVFIKFQRSISYV